MKYHAPTKQFVVAYDQFQSCAANMLFAIKMVRKAAGLPLEGGEPQATMSPACHAEQAILDACHCIGIDIGATRAGVLDVRNAG